MATQIAFYNGDTNGELTVESADDRRLRLVTRVGDEGQQTTVAATLTYADVRKMREALTDWLLRFRKDPNDRTYTQATPVPKGGAASDGEGSEG
jgi:hypothetical protein